MRIRPIFLLAVFFLTQASLLSAQTIRDIYEQAVQAYNQEDYDRSIELYKTLTKEAPHFAPAYVGIGLALKAKGADTQEVLYYYKTATEMDPTNTQAMEQLGRLYYSVNDFNKAERVFNKALKIDPGMKDVRLSLAWIYLLYKPRPEIAKKYFLEALKTNKDPSVYLGLGMAYFANNERVEALDLVTRLKQMGHDDFAKRLEEAMRENRKVYVDSNQSQDAPEQGDAPSLESPIASNAPVKEDSPPAEDAASSPSGVKVRLRGKLAQID